MTKFEGRVALVTGGASGIGRATALEFAKNGATVVIADMSDENGAAVVKEIETSGGTALYVKTDVMSEDSVRSLIDTIDEKFGRLDFAHNNAGYGFPPKAISDMTLKDFHATVDMHLTSIFICLQQEMRLMVPAGRGAIVNTSSGAGINGVSHLSGYCAAKSGVIAFTKVAAMEYATQGIRVNSVAPGATQTTLIDNVVSENPEMMDIMIEEAPQKRIGLPHELAAAVVFLCSDEASFITGATLPVDGGRTAY